MSLVAADAQDDPRARAALARALLARAWPHGARSPASAQALATAAALLPAAPTSALARAEALLDRVGAHAPLDSERLGALYARHGHTPTQRKSCGVFYSPGSLIERLLTWVLPSSGLRCPVRVLDPACGTGAMLLAAASHLLDAGLTPQDVFERCVFGVELDPVAAALTRAQLVLMASVHLPQPDALARVARRARDAVVCADALTWAPAQGQAPQVILTNPPYVLAQRPKLSAAARAALCARFVSATYKIDLYTIFIELCLGWLAPHGRLGALTPSAYLTSVYDEPLRRWLLSQHTLQELAIVPGHPFEDAVVEVALLCARQGQAPPGHALRRWSLRDPQGSLLGPPAPSTQSELLALPGSPLIARAPQPHARGWLERLLASSQPLGQHCQAYFGAQTRSRALCVRPWDGLAPPPGWAPCLDGAHIQPFLRLRSAHELVSTRPEDLKSGSRHEVHAQPRVVVRQIGHRPLAALAPAGRWALNTVYQLYLRPSSPLALEFILGVVQSDLVARYWALTHADPKARFPKITKQALLSIPLPALQLSRPEHRLAHDHVVQLTCALRDSPHELAAQTRQALERALERLYEVGPWEGADPLAPATQTRS